jgi:hypothetical protein
MLVALANRGALALKNANIAAKNTMRAMVAGRNVTTSASTSNLQAAAGSAAAQVQGDVTTVVMAG